MHAQIEYVMQCMLITEFRKYEKEICLPLQQQLCFYSDLLYTIPFQTPVTPPVTISKNCLLFQKVKMHMTIIPKWL